MLQSVHIRSACILYNAMHTGRAQCWDNLIFCLLFVSCTFTPLTLLCENCLRAHTRRALILRGWRTPTVHDKYKIVKISGVKLSVHRWTTTCSHTSTVKLLFTHRNVISSLSFVLYGPARIYLLKGKIMPFPRRIQDTLEIMKNCVCCMFVLSSSAAEFVHCRTYHAKQYFHRI